MVYFGFMIANFGMIMSSSNPNFISPLETIAALDVSEPLAGSVVIAPIGTAVSGVADPSKKSHTSPS